MLRLKTKLGAISYMSNQQQQTKTKRKTNNNAYLLGIELDIIEKWNKKDFDFLKVQINELYNKVPLVLFSGVDNTKTKYGLTFNRKPSQFILDWLHFIGGKYTRDIKTWYVLINKVAESEKARLFLSQLSIALKTFFCSGCSNSFERVYSFERANQVPDLKAEADKRLKDIYKALNKLVFEELRCTNLDCNSTDIYQDFNTIDRLTDSQKIESVQNDQQTKKAAELCQIPDCNNEFEAEKNYTINGQMTKLQVCMDCIISDKQP